MIEIINDARVVKARKDHVCNYCGGIIKKGEKHTYGVFKFDYIYQWRNHFKCGELVSTLKMEGDYGITEEIFYEDICDKFKEIWRGKDESYVKSKEFKSIPFLEKVEFVYEHVIEKIK